MGAQKVILAELNREVGGAAEAFGETTAGKVAKFRNELGDLTEGLVVGLMPALSDWLDIARDLVGWMSENEDTVRKVADALVITAAAVVALNVATKIYEGTVGAIKLATEAWTVAQWALDAALAANPVGLLIIGIALIVAGIFLITKGLEGLGFTWGDVWDQAVGWLKLAWDWVGGVWDKITGFVSSVPDQVEGAFRRIAAAISNPFIDAFNWIARQWNNTLGKLSANIPGIGVVDVPDIGFAARMKYGGRAQGGMPYVIGDGSGPELWVPDGPGTIVSNPADGGQWGGDTYVTVQVGGETIAAVARAERVAAAGRTRQWVKATNASTVGGTA
jgi:phage-related protein